MFREGSKALAAGTIVASGMVQKNETDHVVKKPNLASKLHAANDKLDGQYIFYITDKTKTKHLYF